MTQSKSTLKRYNLVLPEDLFDQVKKVAESRHTSMVEVIRRFIRLGLIVAELEETSRVSLLVREGELEREIILI